jgi:hypothetical protein
MNSEFIPFDEGPAMTHDVIKAAYGGLRSE